EITDVESKENSEYLLVELVDKEQGVDYVRNLDKRKYNEPIVNEKLNKREKSRKILEVKPEESLSLSTQKGNDKRQFLENNEQTSQEEKELESKNNWERSCCQNLNKSKDQLKNQNEQVESYDRISPKYDDQLKLSDPV
ncbi:12154_t:CDS:2, partial [Dentiscutata heterogama]